MKKTNLFTSNFDLVKKCLFSIGLILSTLYVTEKFQKSVMKSVKFDTVGKINAVLNQDLDCELTFWGASTALVNINTKLIHEFTGLSVMNMGIDGTNIDQYNGLLLNYLDYTVKSRYIFIVLDFQGSLVKREKFYDFHRWVHHFDNDFIYKSHFDINPIESFKIKHIPFFPLLHYDKHSFSYIKQMILNDNDKYNFPNYGYVPNGVVFKSMLLSPFKSKFDSRPFNKTLDVCNLAIEKNIKPIIILPPFYSKNNDFKRNKLELLEYLKKLENDKIYLWDFMDDPISKDSLLYNDYAHLNSIGAMRLTNKIIDKIKTIQ